MSTRITSLALIAAALAMSTEAGAFEIKHSAEGELVSWRRGSVTWIVDRSVHKVPGAEAAVIAAADAWTQRGGAPSLVAGGPDSAIKPGFDRKNAVVYESKGFPPAGDVLAVTVLSFDDNTGEVLDADIVLNGKYHLGTIDPAAPAPPANQAALDATYDVRRVLAHEMGHALGLSDEPAQPDALMFPVVARSRALAASPGSDDLAGLNALYGSAGRASTAAAPSASSGCGAVVAPSRPRHTPGTTFVAAGLLMAALAIARRPGRGRRGAAGCTVFAAAALVALPPLSADRAQANPYAIVTGARTTSEDGIFRTELDLGCSDGACPARRMIVWGGTLNGVRQVIGDARVPVVGDRVSE